MFVQHNKLNYLVTRCRDKQAMSMMNYLKWTKDEKLALEADGTNVIRWGVDAAFALHPDMRSHRGAIMTLGKGAIQSMSSKQKLNTRG